MSGRRWYRAVALTLVASVACVLLGFWQLDRREGKLARIAVVEGNWDAAPRALPDVLAPSGARLAGTQEYTPVAVTGTYERSSTVLVRNRPQDGVFGYYVLVPLRLDPASGGGVLVVNRGLDPPRAGRGRSGRRAGATVGRRERRGAPASPRGGRRARRPREGQVQRIDVGGTVRRAVAAEGGVDGDLVSGGLRPAGLGVPEPGARARARARAGRRPRSPPGLLGAVVRLRRRDVGAARGAGAAQPRRGGGGRRGPALARLSAARERARARRRVDEDAEDALLDAAERR